MNRTASILLSATLACSAIVTFARPAGAATEAELRANWVGRWVVLRSPVLSNCDVRYTNNRMHGTHPTSAGAHRFDPGELGRIDNLHLQRARIDLLVTLTEPLRVAFRDGPFEIHEQLECRVELEVPAPRAAVRGGAVDRLDELIDGILQASEERQAAELSPRWNRRRVEPLPEDHEDRLAAYDAWKQEQLYHALRGRLAEALDRAAEIAARADRSVAYARGLVLGARDFEADRLFSAGCGELPEARFSASWGKAPEELEGSDERDWKDGFEDGQRLRFEIGLARRLERCLP